MGDEVAVARPAPSAAVSRSSVVNSASWSAVGRTGAQALQFLVGLALARLLVPADFGLLASVYVVTGFTVLLFDMGVGAALVHQRDLRQQDLDTAFWLNALGGLVFVGLLAAIGPLVADFYGDERLVYITPLAGLGFALALNVCHSALLQRSMQFKRIALIELACAVAGNASTLVAALAGWGALSLVVGPTVQAVASTVLMWSLVRWRPRGFITRSSVRHLWRFSGGMLGFNVVNYAGRNTDNLLVGRILGASALGLYNRAYTLMLLPLQQVSQVLGRVMFPALATMRDDLPRLQNVYRRSITTMSAIIMPVMVGMAVTADGLVPLLWGQQWLATVPMLQVLCLAGLPQCLSSSEGWLYQSQGRTTTMFRVGLASTAVTIVAIVVGLQWGVLGVAVGVLVKMWLWQPIGFHFACGTIGLRARRVFADIAPVLSVSVLMGGAVWGLPLALGLERDAPLALGAQVIAGASIYPVLLRLLAKDVLRDVLGLVPARLLPGRADRWAR
ncbi:lipopolysaccharide biosynthesis protein [Kineococcus gypseus]|uniref:lipopolysaccharide biosynthesis protein n=1 Tax=Kineococcus gypseus TaxID=1637102 RepID=UPI003D7C442C